MKVRARCGIAIQGDCLRSDVTWSVILIHQGQQTILHCFIFKNYRTDCLINLKDSPDKFEIYRKSSAVLHLCPSLDYASLILIEKINTCAFILER